MQTQSLVRKIRCKCCGGFKPEYEFDLNNIDAPCDDCQRGHWNVIYPLHEERKSDIQVATD